MKFSAVILPILAGAVAAAPAEQQPTDQVAPPPWAYGPPPPIVYGYGPPSLLGGLANAAGNVVGGLANTAGNVVGGLVGGLADVADGFVGPVIDGIGTAGDVVGSLLGGVLGIGSDLSDALLGYRPWKAHYTQQLEEIRAALAPINQKYANK